jgi:hypothetical protein
MAEVAVARSSTLKWCPLAGCGHVHHIPRKDEIRRISDRFYSGLDRMDVSALPEV